MPEESWRSNLPEDLKRILRKDAGFGCCRCGFPIFDYHHIAPPSENPEDLMLLCPNCHRAATQGAMLESEQRYFRLEPYNIKRGYVKGQLIIRQNALALSVGSNQFIGDGRLIMVDTEDLVSIGLNEDGRLDLSVNLYDNKDKLIAKISHNEWQSGDTFPWDLQSSYQRISIRSRSRNISLEIDARKYPIEVRGDFWWKKQNFKLGNDWTTLNPETMSIKVGNLCFVGGCFIADSITNALKIVRDPRYGRMMMISNADVQERLKEGFKALETLRAESKVGN